MATAITAVTTAITAAVTAIFVADTKSYSLSCFPRGQLDVRGEGCTQQVPSGMGIVLEWIKGREGRICVMDKREQDVKNLCISKRLKKDRCVLWVLKGIILILHGQRVRGRGFVLMLTLQYAQNY